MARAFRGDFMRSMSRTAALFLFAAIALTTAPARGSFHEWRIKEIFTNADGTVQFIEFFTPSAGQQFLNGHNLTATSDGGTPVSFTFIGDLTVPVGQTTANKHFLLATAAFDLLPGSPTPNFTPLPNSFFSPTAASIDFSFAHGQDNATVAGSLIPKDGVNSITDSVLAVFPNVDTDSYSSGLNSPTNFAGTSGSVNAAPLAGADFTENGVVNGFDLANWRTNFGLATGATHLQGDSDSDMDVDGRDFLKWQEQTTNAGAVVAVPEPATGATTTLALVAAARAARQRRRPSRLR